MKIYLLLLGSLLPNFTFDASAQEQRNIVQIREQLSTMFAAASSEFNVPTDLLKAIAFVESRWVQRQPRFVEGMMPPSYGVMGLRDDDHFGHSLREAARLLDVDVSVPISDAQQNVRSAAALIRNYADETRGSKDSITQYLESWKRIIERYCGIPQSDLAELYAFDVYSILSRGYDEAGIKIEQREIDLPIFSNKARGFDRSHGVLAQPDYPGARWTPANSANYAISNRPSTYTIDRVVVHVTEGSYAGSISWFQNSAAQASAHYVVRSIDGDVTQMVEQKDVAWHSGNSSFNHRSVGIECEGYVDDPSYFTPSLYSSVASVVQFICTMYGITKDRVRIVGHNQVPDPNNGTLWGGANHHSDPGGYWKWSTFMQTASGQSPTFVPVEVVNTATLNVRTGPASTEPLLTAITQGQRFVSYAQSNGWYLVFMPGQTTDHFDGWSSGSYLAPVATGSGLEVGGTWPGGLNVRSGTTSGSSVIDKISDGQRFVATGAAQIGSDGYIWYQFHLPQSSGSLTGWSSGFYLNAYPLPIQLGAFTGRFLNNGYVRIDWMTVSEINNFGFFIQRRRTEQQEWEELARSFVAGHGTSNIPQRYSFVDSTALVGNWYYRLKQVDLDGSLHWTDPLEVQALTAVKDIMPHGFSLAQNYPNPFNPSTTISYSISHSSNVTLSIFSMLGQQVATLVDEPQDAGTYATTWNAEGLASGVYYYRLQAGDFVQTRKLLLLR